MNVQGSTTSARQDELYEEYVMAARFIAEALQRGGKVVVSCPNGLDCSATVMLTYLIKEGIPLLGGYKLLKCFEPLIQLSRSNTLFVTLCAKIKDGSRRRRTTWMVCGLRRLLPTQRTIHVVWPGPYSG